MNFFMRQFKLIKRLNNYLSSRLIFHNFFSVKTSVTLASKARDCSKSRSPIVSLLISQLYINN